MCNTPNSKHPNNLKEWKPSLLDKNFFVHINLLFFFNWSNLAQKEKLKIETENELVFGGFQSSEVRKNIY